MCEEFSGRLKKLRKKNGFTQVQLARMLGKAESTVRMWELGKNEPNHNALANLARIFDVSIDYLLGQFPASGSTAPLSQLEQRPMLKRLFELAQQISDENLTAIIHLMEGLQNNGHMP